MNKINVFNKFNKKNTAVLFCTFVLFLLLLNVNVIAAYFADADEKVNVLSIGHNEITVEEEFDPPAKGQKTVKNPTARNTGSVDCYVRAKIVVSDSRACPYFEYYNNDSIGFNTQEWIESNDGWMYYDTILEPGENTSPLFTHIKLLDNIPDAFLGFTIDVVFESVQSNDFESAKDAFAALTKGGGL